MDIVTEIWKDPIKMTSGFGSHQIQASTYAILHIIFAEAHRYIDAKRIDTVIVKHIYIRHGLQKKNVDGHKRGWAFQRPSDTKHSYCFKTPNKPSQYGVPHKPNSSHAKSNSSSSTSLELPLVLWTICQQDRPAYARTYTCRYCHFSGTRPEYFFIIKRYKLSLYILRQKRDPYTL